MRRLACLFVLAACSNSAGGGHDGGELVAELDVRTVATLPAEPFGALSMIALDGERVAVARVERSGDALCPDCVELDPAVCPAQCERSQVSISVLEMATGTFAAPRSVATVFPASFDHSVDQVELVALGGDRVGVGWLDCDNSRCTGLFAKRSCTARYTTLDLETGTTGAVQTLYTNWFGDLSLAFEPTSRTLLAVIGKNLATGTGLFRAIFDETAVIVVSPWRALGSDAARSPAVLASGGEFVIVADDWAPSAAPRATPCEQSCDCLASNHRIDLDHGGLFAFRVNGVEADRVEHVAAGRDDDGFYGRREEIHAIDAGGHVAIATTQSIDRAAEIFVHDGSAWQLALATRAPIPMWIGALGSGDRYAWLGSQPEPGESTVSRLVAGVVAGAAHDHGTFTEPLDRNVFLAAPVQTASGVTTTFLLQGVFARAEGMISWDRFEILAVDAAWP